MITREIKEEIKNAVSNILKEIINQGDLINNIADKVSESIAKTVNKKIQQLEQNIQENQDKIEEIKLENSTVVNQLKMDIGELKNDRSVFIKKYDKMEQEGKKNNLRIFNFKEIDQENLKTDITTILNSKLSINLTEEEIVTCYRIGKKGSTDKPRGILIKLSNTQVKQQIYNKKKYLKGTGVVIKEDLTEGKLKLMEKAIEKSSIRNVWSNRGIVYVMKNNNKIILNNEEDLKKL